MDVTIETASISTFFGARDDDLRSDRFLDSDTHPTITYHTTSIVERSMRIGDDVSLDIQAEAILSE